MNTLTDFNSPEKEIVLNILDSIDNSEKWIASIVENYIYKHNNQPTKDGKTFKFRSRFGLEDGPFKCYIGERLLIESFYINGLLEGEYKYYYQSGGLMEHCYYKNGKKIGEYKFFNEDGTIYDQRVY
jgi:antitoxin component YwqK of YwqJK toxin-antitoxin module